MIPMIPPSIPTSLCIQHLSVPIEIVGTLPQPPREKGHRPMAAPLILPLANPARQLQQVVVSASKYQESNLELPFASGALFMLDRVCKTIGQVTQVRQVTPLEAPDFSVCPVCDFRLPAKVENDAR
jgi:hypothetical protein